MNNDEQKIIDITEKLTAVLGEAKAFINKKIADIMIKFEDNIVYIKMIGACANCHFLDFTLKEGIELAIKEEVPSVKEVINIEI